VNKFSGCLSLGKILAVPIVSVKIPVSLLWRWQCSGSSDNLFCTHACPHTLSQFNIKYHTLHFCSFSQKWSGQF
jgi:hypothetical protein